MAGPIRASRALRALCLAALTVWLGAAGPTAAAHVPAARPAFLTDVRSFVVIGQENGRAYQISVALPDGYSRRHGPYPVLYVTDANVEFGIAAETARLLAFGGAIPGLVVVGIGYPNPGQGFAASNAPRTFDLTPTPDPEWIRAAAAETPPSLPVADSSGGGPQFLAFLRAQLIPSIERRYNVSHEDRGLAGHSFGGLFATYTLLHNDGLFRRFLIGSPSLWWDHYALLKMDETYAASGRPLRARVFLSTGGLEDGTGGHPMASDFKTFAAALAARNYRGLELQSHVFEGEDHISVIGATFSRGLKSIYGP